eukprot:5514327-Lingulodinium_polyedra.AAC.1
MAFLALARVGCSSVPWEKKEQKAFEAILMSVSVFIITLLSCGILWAHGCLAHSMQAQGSAPQKNGLSISVALGFLASPPMCRAIPTWVLGPTVGEWGVEGPRSSLSRPVSSSTSPGEGSTKELYSAIWIF